MAYHRHIVRSQGWERYRAFAQPLFSMHFTLQVSLICIHMVFAWQLHPVSLVYTTWTIKGTGRMIRLLWTQFTRRGFPRDFLAAFTFGCKHNCVVKSLAGFSINLWLVSLCRFVFSAQYTVWWECFKAGKFGESPAIYQTLILSYKWYLYGQNLSIR